MVVAIDGPAGAGKSTVARALAERLGYRYLDTGAMYRAVTLCVPVDGADAAEAWRAPAPGGHEGDHSAAVSLEVERSGVRWWPSSHRCAEAMREAQRAFLARGDAVGEGRDVGAVVWPEAELKIWLDAAPLVRARRRVEELGDASAAEALAERDERDAARTVHAPDAVAIDSSDLELDAVVDRIVALARERRP